MKLNSREFGQWLQPLWWLSWVAGLPVFASHLVIVVGSSVRSFLLA